MMTKAPESSTKSLGALEALVEGNGRAFVLWSSSLSVGKS